MKIALALIIATLPLLSSADSFSSLGRANVTHLQLLLNNLNMFILNNIDDFKKDQKGESEPAIELIKFRLTTESNLLIEIYSTTTVADVTSANCNKSAARYKNDLLGDEKTEYLFWAFSYYDIPTEDVRAFVSKAVYQVMLSAKENKQLSISCAI